MKRQVLKFEELTGAMSREEMQRTIGGADSWFYDFQGSYASVNMVEVYYTAPANSMFGNIQTPVYLPDAMVDAAINAFVENKAMGSYIGNGPHGIPDGWDFFKNEVNLAIGGYVEGGDLGDQDGSIITIKFADQSGSIYSYDNGNTWKYFLTTPNLPNSGAGGGGGAGSGGPGTPGYNPNDPGNCIFDLLSYLSNTHSTSGYSYSPEYYYNLYASLNNPWDFNYNSSGELVGVTTNTNILTSLMSSTISAFSIPPSDLMATLNSGHQVAAMLPNQGPNGEGHAIVIESYNGDGTFKIFNPTLGINQSVTGGQLAGTNFLIAIN